MLRSWAIASVIAVAASPGICSSDEDSPQTAYAHFARAFDQGDVPALWGLLSAKTQAELTQRAKEIAAFEHTKPPADGRLLAFRHALMAHRSVSKIAVKDESADHATLEVTDDKNGTQIIHVVHEHGKWLLDLTRELEAAARRQ